MVFHATELVLAKILVSQNTQQSLREADELLDRLWSRVDESNNIRWAVEVRALQALLEDAKGSRTKALSLLQQALELAEPGGVLRVFVDLGPQMADLLTLLQRHSGTSDFIARILQAFSPSDTKGIDLIYNSPVVANQVALIEPLTIREMEVLEMLAQRLTAKEIGSSLFISERTVKRHTANIYQKLGVNSRQQAVASAALLGILPDPLPRGHL